MAGRIGLKGVLTLLCVVVILVSTAGAEEVFIKKKGPAEPGNGLVLIESESESVEIGDSIHLFGQVDRSLIGGNPSDVVILISAPEGSLADTFVLSSPDWSGSFDYLLPADVGGAWGFEALYAGIYSPKITIEAVPSAEPGKTTLTLSGWPAYPQVGESVTFKGRLTDSSGKGVSNREIAYEFSSSRTGCITGCWSADLDNAEWHLIGSERTDLSGGYRFSLPVVEAGGVNIRVRFEGDDQYSPSESRVLGITASNP